MVSVTFTTMLRHSAAIIVLAGAFAYTVTTQGPPPADLVLLDARILTVDAAFRTAAALAVRNGRFVVVGSNDEARRHIGSTTQVIDGRGRTVVPGFIDTHVHALDVASAEATQPFVNLRSIKDVQDWLRKEAPRRPQGSWIWTPRTFPTRLREGRFPTRRELDAAAPDHAVVVDSAYAFSLNTAALRAAGITRDSPNPPGGAIVRDVAGEPTGLLRNAGGLLARFRPAADAMPLGTLERVHRQYLAAGITSVIERGATRPGFEAYRRLKDAGRLHVRATVTLRVPDATDPAGIERFIQDLPFTFGEGDDWLKAGPLKIVADGGILIGTSFMRKPFGRGGRDLYAIDNPADRGFLTLTPEQIASAIAVIHRRGWQMVAHVTGDAGVDVVLDGIEAAQKLTPALSNDRRHTVIHGYFANRESASRAARLGVLVDTQPAWHYKDGDALARALGADRLAHFIGLKTLRQSGVDVAINTDHMFGLDANDAMNPFNPLLTIYAATTRRTESGRVLGADEAVTRQEALRMMTSAAARFSFDETQRGSIEPGKVGDFVILNDHILTVPAERLRTMRVDLSVVGGRIAFDAETRTAPMEDRPGEWRSYGRDAGGSRYAPLTQITRDNVGRLAQAWVYHHGERLPEAGREGPAFESTPLVVGDLLYFTSPAGRVIALDPETGAERWTFDPRPARPGGAPRHRGVAYWEAGGDRRVFVGTLDGRLIALDALTGTPKSGFGDNGEIRVASDLSLRSPPAIFKNLVITGAAAPEFPGTGPPGDVRAFDARTGRQVWEFHTVPRTNEAGNDTWEKDSWRGRTGANVWSMIAVDEARGLVFLPIGSASYDFYGGDRKGRNLYANSVVALDAASGRLRWHFQTVHHDLWDYDLPAQPVLVTVRRDGRPVDAVAQVGKTGFVYVLDRETGRPLFPIEERAVPASTVPGEAAWPTQPFPAKPPPLARVEPLTRDDLSTVTPEARASCEALFDRVISGGLFTPPGEKLTLVFPGNLGGATWSGAAFDPSSGYLFVNVNELGAVGEMRKASGPIAYRRGSDLPRGEYARFWDERRWPCQKPPWGTFTAVNLHEGSIAWRVPLGIVDELAATGLTNTGAPNLGGAIVTAGGLVFIAGTNDRRMRAFDARTGATLWETTLPASGHATPITYLGPRSGRQFVAIAAGGGGYLSSTYSDALVAFSLPTQDARPPVR